MRYDGGWIKMHRRFCRMQKNSREKSQFYGDCGMQSVFIFLVLNATYEPCHKVLPNIGKPLELGQVLTSYTELMAWSGLTRKMVNGRLTSLAKDGAIEVNKEVKRGLLVTINNYEKYQSNERCEVKFEVNNRDNDRDIGGQQEVPYSEEDKEDKKISMSTGVDLCAVWNSHCGSLPKAKAMSTKRRTSAKARLKENSQEEYWVAVVQRIAKSEFCLGKNTSGWKANFDWILKPDSHIKVSEGLYDNKSATPRKHSKNYDDGGFY